MRFVFDMKALAKKKVKDAFEIPSEIDFSDFSEFIRVEDDAKYKLVAVLHHKGSTAFHGHYTADLYDSTQEKWWNFDDETVTPIAGTGTSQYDGASK